MSDLSHLIAATDRLVREEARLSQAINAGNDKEAELRAVWVRQNKEEIEAEIAFLQDRGVTVPAYLMPVDDAPMTMDEILAELEA